MKPLILILTFLAMAAWNIAAQGRIGFHTFIPTRLWSADGPVAGPGIWGQLLAGPTVVSLSPIGVPVEHDISGVIGWGGIIEVPTVPCDTYGYVQMAAWDGTLWGTMLEGVPLDQLGYTDVVSVPMTCFPAPTSAPPFTQPAIVPVPEPSVLTLACLVLGVLFMLVWNKKGKDVQSRSHEGSSPLLGGAERLDDSTRGEY